MNVAAAVEQLTASLTKLGTATRAVQAQRYMKSELHFLGVTVPAVRRAAKTFVRAQPQLGRSDLRALTERLWATQTHELRSLAIGMLELRVDLLRPSDTGWLGKLIDNADTWAHVDWLAVKVVGALLTREPALQAQLDRWAQHDNFWLRRTALLALHDPLLAGKGDFDHFTRLAVPMLAEREFFIRKAIGWVLRSTARRTPARTYAFTARHAAQMSALTFKEATRNLSPPQQKRLQALRSSGQRPR